MQTVDNSGLTISTDGDNASGTVRLIPLGLNSMHRLTVLLLPINKNWGSREPFKSALNSPALTVVERTDDSHAEITIAYNIPQYPDWKRSRVKSSIDGVISILDAPLGLSGPIESGELLKPNWQDSTTAILRLPEHENTDFIWIEHEYEFGGTLNSLLTPLPAAGGFGTTTTTPGETTTTTTTGGSTTEATTTTTTGGPKWNLVSTETTAATPIIKALPGYTSDRYPYLDYLYSTGDGVTTLNQHEVWYEIVSFIGPVIVVNRWGVEETWSQYNMLTWEVIEYYLWY